uniref:hypothetical protein n=1 Tax=Levilactobacillus namurensis TaxID=380393 RepID=UPI00046374E4
MVKNEVRQFLANIAPQQPIWVRYREPDHLQREYRDEENHLVALAIYSTNSIHPTALGMTVVAEDAHLFSVILADAQQEARRQKKVRLVTWEFQPFSQFTDWLLTQGFAIWRQTVEPMAKLASITVTRNATIQAVTLAEVIANQSLKKQLLTWSLRQYQRVHAINPMAPTSVEKWSHLALPEALPNAPVALIRQGKLVAYTFLFEDDPGVLTFAWMGAHRIDDLWALQEIQIKWAQRQGMKQLTGEFDSTDDLAWQTARKWPFEPAPSYTMIGQQLPDNFESG